MTIYEGPCPRCELPRRFELVLDEAMPPEQSDDHVALGAGRSQGLDPGELVAAADVYAKRVPAGELSGAGRYSLQLAIACIDEALKFDDVEAATRSRVGWQQYDYDPGRFSRDRLLVLREAYRKLVGGRPYLASV